MVPYLGAAVDRLQSIGADHSADRIFQCARDHRLAARFSGVTQGLHAFHSIGAGDILWKLFVAILYFALGIYLLTNPLVGITTLTLILGIFFLAEGGIDLAVYIKGWRSDGSLWILLEALATLVLGLMLLRQWPSDSLWALGTLVGIGMLVTGIGRLMISLAVYRLSESTTPQR